MRCSFLICLSSILLSVSSGIAQRTPVDSVNERIGTANEGQTYPATGMPYAMTQWTPQTRAGNVKCVAPYYDADSRIQGFRGSHFLSGSCVADYGNVTLMPLSGELKLDAVERASAFDRSSEVLHPYRYAVTLKDYGIDTELTATTRVGLLRFHFNKGGKSWVLVETNSVPGDGAIQIDPERGEVLVTDPVRRQYAGKGKLAGFSGYSVVRFDHKFQIGGVWEGVNKHPGELKLKGTQHAPGAYLLFELKPGEVVEAKVGMSFTSLEAARRNMEAELPGWNFEETAAHVKVQWDAVLSRIEVPENAPQRETFYTALYHSMLVPRTFSDASGTYPGFANEGRTEVAKNFTYYDDFSIWDTFRAVHPLITLMEPRRELDMVKSLIAKGEQGGYLPIFPAWNSYTSEMVGDHAVAVISDAYMKGIRDFDVEKAYSLMRKNAMELPADRNLYIDGRGRRALDSYLKYGYIPLEDHVLNAFHQNEQVSRTLEYAYDDFLVGEMAQALGHKDDAKMFHHRAQNYRNVIDPETGFARGRHADGTWITPFDPTKKATYITEGLPNQYTFFVIQDLPGLIDLVGGPKVFIDKLDGVFAGNYYDHGNEPSHHLAYLYNSAGAAWKTQQHVREILNHQYANTPSGLAGNDDSGQMSAWYVMSALGFYAVTPGTPIYQIGTPLFDDTTIQLSSGKKFHIRAEGASAGKFYIQSAMLNGIPLKRSWLRHSDIVAGGELFFVMSDQPAKGWPGE